MMDGWLSVCHRAPRPFLGGAIAAKGEEVKEVFGKKAMAVIEHKK
jgi:hypothetical protein